MAGTSFRLSLILRAGVLALLACAPKANVDPPSRTPTVESSSDAGLPMVPLTGKGVVVPSDVKLDPGPKDVARPAASATSATATPTGN
jgi:hypothetical protein